MAGDYHWYDLCEGPQLLQGEILGNCPAPVPPLPADAPLPTEPIEGREYDRVIVLSHSCDLTDAGIRSVLLCPLYPVNDWAGNFGGKQKQEAAKENVRRGKMPAYHLINPCRHAGYEFGHLVADFGDTFGLPIEYVKGLAVNIRRVRLNPPYREHLSQAFARFHMRVGLPIEYDPFP